MHQPACILFDLDGTLVDTARDFHAGVNRLRRLDQLPDIDFEVIRTVVSEGARAVIAAGFPHLSPDSEAFEARRIAFLDHYAAHHADHAVVFPGLVEVLDMLDARDLPWGVVTNKARRFTLPLMDALGLGARAATIVCPDDVTHPKPDPEPMRLAAAQAGVAAERCIYVGDHRRDIDAGRAAGMHTVAVGWGYVQAGDSPADWQADTLCEQVDDFARWLNYRL